MPTAQEKSSEPRGTAQPPCRVRAELPIVLAYIDYANKRVGLGPEFQPTGDIERDMEVIKAFYAPLRGKHAR